MKYRFVTGLHGNEPIPVIALAQRGVEQYVANSKALSVNKRFIDIDLNKAFGAEGSGYEFQRAEEILKDINDSETIVDFHTFSAESDPFAIIVDESMLDLAIETGLPHIVIMEHNIKNGHALINHRRGISVEVGHHNSFVSFKNTQNVYHNLNEKKGIKNKPNIFRVIGLISEPGEYINFEKTDQGFFPILAGEKAYDFYGLKAVKEKYEKS